MDPLPVTLASAFSQEPVTVTAPAADALARRGAVLDSLAVLARTLLSGREALRRFDETLRFADGLGRPLHSVRSLCESSVSI